jgi:hypothetical protein
VIEGVVPLPEAEVEEDFLAALAERMNITPQ